MRLADHYYVEDRSGNIYVVIGYMHPPGELVAYLKYRPLPHGLRSPWCRGPSCFERVVKQYNVATLLSTHQRLVWDPVYGVEVPMLPLSEIQRVYEPRSRLHQIASSPRDPVEKDLLDTVARIADTSSLHMDRFGVTGSILVGIHGPHSDMDITVHGCREAVEVVETLRNSGLAEPLPAKELESWVRLQARLHGLDPEQAARLYRPWRRGTIGGRIFSLIPIDEARQQRYGERVYRSYGEILVEAETDTGYCGSLFYPSRTPVHSYRVVEGVTPPRPVEEIMCFEGVFSPTLYEASRVLVRGELLCWDEGCTVLVGSRSVGGWVVPGKAWRRNTI